MEMSTRWNFSCYWCDGYICQILVPFLSHLNTCGCWTCIRRLFAFAICSSFVGLHIRIIWMTGVTIQVGLYAFMFFLYHNYRNYYNFEDFSLRLVFKCRLIRKGSFAVTFVVVGLGRGYFSASLTEVHCSGSGSFRFPRLVESSFTLMLSSLKCWQDWLSVAGTSYFNMLGAALFSLDYLSLGFASLSEEGKRGENLSSFSN